MGDLLEAIEQAENALSLRGWIGLGATVLAGGVLIVLARHWLPRACRTAFGALDRRVPAGLGEHDGTIARFLVWTVTGVVLFVVGLTAAGILGLDIAGVTGALKLWGVEVVEWLLPNLVRIGVLIAVTVAVVRVIRATVPRAVSRALSRRATRRHRPAGEASKRTTTLAGVAVTACTWFVVLIAFFVGVSELGFDIAPMLAGAGVLGLAVGFGAQNMVRDFFSGIFILLEDQYRIGDVVEVGGKIGVVEELDLRRTVMRDLDKIVHTVPNGEIKTSSNYTKVVSQVHFDVEVAYKENIDRVIEVIDRIGREMYDEDCCEGAMLEPISVLRVNGFGSSGIAIKVLGQTEPGTQWAVAGEFRRRLKIAFDAEGIEIPFPHRTLYWGADQPGLGPIDAQRSERAGDDGSRERPRVQA